MREFPFVLQAWVYPFTAAVLAPLAVVAGIVCDWSPGAASLAALMVPVCCAGLTGSRKTFAETAVVAAGACLVEAFLRPGAATDPQIWIFPGVSAVILLGTGALVTHIGGRLQERVRELSQQKSDVVRDLYERERRSESDSQRAKAEHYAEASNISVEVLAGDLGSLALASEGEGLNYPMLLLTLQDIGRRIATNLDLDQLVPTILSTAKVLLKCDHCQVFLWNPQTRTLRNAIPARGLRATDYAPHPQRGMARWVLEQRHVLTKNDVLKDYDLHAVLDEEPQLPDAVAPLTVGGELLGLLVLHEIEQDSPSFVRLLYILSNISALGIKNAQLFKRIEEMARRDGLTGLLNHASFQERLQQLTKDDIGSAPVTIIMSDVDHFKKFNDTYGHQAGDHVLREVSRIWQAVLPEYAVLARYGGEEFICALPGVDTARGLELAELLRGNLESFPLDFEGRQLNVTASFGVAEFGRPARKPAEVVRLADEALYKAKQAGRNRVCSHLSAPSSASEA